MCLDVLAGDNAAHAVRNDVDLARDRLDHALQELGRNIDSLIGRVGLGVAGGTTTKVYAVEIIEPVGPKDAAPGGPIRWLSADAVDEDHRVEERRGRGRRGI